MHITPEFWEQMDRLLATWPIEIDRPKGTAHPRYSAFIMPLDYGYLVGTSASDGNGIDCWCGSLPRDRVAGVMVSLDMIKRDTEIKLMIGCTPEEMLAAWETVATDSQGAILVERGMS